MYLFLVDALIPFSLTANDAEKERLRRETAAFVDQAIKRAPWFVRFADVFLTPGVALLLYFFMRFGRKRGLSTAEACKPAISFLALWGGPFASLIRLYQYLTALYYFDHPLVYKHFKQELPADRQKRFREIHDRLQERAP